MKRVYTVYKTTNLINGSIYIGVHKTSNINDTYIGSGKLLKSAIKKCFFILYFCLKVVNELIELGYTPKVFSYDFKLGSVGDIEYYKSLMQ